MKTIVLLLLLNSLAAFSQTDSTYAERLFFPKGKKVLILHIDDAGMSFDSNKGVVEALTKGVANSVSVMMPCPWVPGFVRFLKENPKVDAGLHLTLTSEWRDYRWGPLSGKPKVPGLVDTAGAMWAGVEEVVQHASADEVEWEIKAQLERALAMGFKPTHLDSHMGTLFATPAFIERYVKLGMTYKIPVMFPAGHNTLIKAQMGADDSRLRMARTVGEMLWNAGLPVLDDLHNESYGWSLPAGTKAD
jgi:chitin disaccharide deacetylase